MRAVPTAFAPLLAAPTTTLALCWKIVRTDGVALGMTTHDAPVTVAGVVYAAAPGLQPSAVAMGVGEAAGAMEIVGALTSDAVSEADLMAGRYDGARVTSFLVDWEQPGAGVMVLATGTIGAVGATDGAFTAELLSAASDLSAVSLERYSPTCRASFGDARCRVSLALHTLVAPVTSVAGLVVGIGAALAPGAYAFGRARVLTGAAAGLDQRIDGSDAGSVTLGAPVAGLAPGALVRLSEGCDKRLATCQGRFGNLPNFRGEPHVPGMDIITQYPGL